MNTGPKKRVKQVRRLGAFGFALSIGLASMQGVAQQDRGQVVAICSTDASWCTQAANEFSKATGVRVLQTHKPTGEALAQLKAEAANPKTDIWWGGTGDPFLQAAEDRLLEPYRPAYMNDLHAWSVRQYASSANMVGGFYTSAIGFGYNEEVLKKKKLPVPKCWADLLAPAYKGEIETSNPASSGTAYTILAGLVQLMGEEEAFTYLKRLHPSITQYTRSGQAQAKSVARGEATIGISFMFGFDYERSAGFPVKTVAPCEGTGYEVGGIALIKGSRNKETALRYYDFLMSPEGQAVGGRANSLQYPANKKAKLDPRIPNMDGVRLVKYDFAKYGSSRERRRLLERFEREVRGQSR
jgi:iron(III) transport system substrate-binding protein